MQGALGVEKVSSFIPGFTENSWRNLSGEKIWRMLCTTVMAATRRTDCSACQWELRGQSGGYCIVKFGSSKGTGTPSVEIQNIF